MIVDPTLYRGAPVPEGRSEAERRCYALLDGLGIEYYRCEHESAGTIEACAAAERVLGGKICRNLFLANRQQTEFYLLLLPGRKPFKTKLLSRQLGVARLSFGSEADMMRLLGLQPGSVSVLGLANDRENRVRLLIDREVLEETWFCCHPCRNTSSLRMSTAALRERLLPALGHEPTLVELPWKVEEE